MDQNYINNKHLLGNLIFWTISFLLLKLIAQFFKSKKLKVNFLPAYILLGLFIIPAILGFTFFKDYWLYLFKRTGHFLTGFLSAYIFDQIFSVYFQKNKIKISQCLYLWLLFASVSGVGVVDEVLDLFMGTVHWVGDSATDLLVNTIGFLIFLLVKKFLRSKRIYS